MREEKKGEETQEDATGRNVPRLGGGFSYELRCCAL